MSSLSLSIRVTSETGPLRHVVLGRGDSFPASVEPGDVINDTIRETVERGALPDRDTAAREFDLLRETLESRSVSVWEPRRVEGVFSQLFTRDVGFVVGERFFVGSMAKEGRRAETDGVLPLVPSGAVAPRFPEDVPVEGGDVVVDGDVVYLGTSERTDPRAAPLLAAACPGFRVVPVPLVPPAPGREALHLDCAFLPVGRGAALVYPAAFFDEPETLFGPRRYVQVTAEEQRSLATNVLSVSPESVISRDRAVRVNDELRALGLDVTALPFDAATSLGGSFRCCTLPLERAAP